MYKFIVVKILLEAAEWMEHDNLKLEKAMKREKPWSIIQNC